MVIGRGSGNDVSVTGEGVLEHHAQIVFNGRDFQLEELDREAEILINGKKKRRARLVNGDRITLGKAAAGLQHLHARCSSDAQDSSQPRATGATSRASASCRRSANA